MGYFALHVYGLYADKVNIVTFCYNINNQAAQLLRAVDSTLSPRWRKHTTLCQTFSAVWSPSVCFTVVMHFSFQLWQGWMSSRITDGLLSAEQTETQRQKSECCVSKARLLPRAVKHTLHVHDWDLDSIQLRIYDRPHDHNAAWLSWSCCRKKNKDKLQWLDVQSW